MTTHGHNNNRREPDKKHEFIETLLETSNSLIICLDKNADITVFNRECERVTGYKADEVLGKNWPSIFLPDDHPAHRIKNFGAWVKEHPSDTYEGPLKTRSGEIRTILWSNSAIFNADSDAITALAVGQDITGRKRAEEALIRTQHELEKRVEERTAELSRRNEELKQQIKNRHRAEEALRESKQRYELATSAGQVGVWDWNLETDEMFIDPRLKAMLGYEDNEIKNQLNDWGKYVHPDDASRVMEEAEKHLSGKAPVYEVIHRMYHRDGSIRWVLARGTAIRDGNGKPVRMLGTDTDITDRYQAEQALKESQERFRKLSDAAEEGIVIHEKGRIIEVNEAALRMFGYTREEFIGKHISETSTPETWAEVERHIKAADETPYEGISIRSDGSQFPCNVVGKEYTYQGKNLRVAVLRDITERKKAEEELIRTKLRLDHLISSSPAVIYSCGPPPDCPTTFISNNITRRLGYEPQDFYDDPFFWSKQIHPDDRERIMKQLAKVDEADALTYEYRFRLRNGNYVWLIDELTVIRNQKGKVTGLIGSWFDISARKEAENKLVETADQLRAERMAITKKNIALREVLNHIEKEREDYKQHICYDVEKSIKPLWRKLRSTADPDKIEDIDALEIRLKNILSREIDVFRDRFARLSPRELEICKLIRDGKSSKQISEQLSLALVTVHKHREIIRKKLGMTNKNINLSSYLQTHTFPNNT